MPQLFLLFSHDLTELQRSDATESLGISKIRHLPADLQECWSQVPPELPDVAEHAQPIWNWLRKEASPKDYVLIQGDFGMSYATVQLAFSLGITPIYATTRRESVEENLPDGSVRKTNRFAHVQFRAYTSHN